MSFIKSVLTSSSPYSIQGQQLINLFTLLIVGKLFLDVHITWLMVGFTITSAVIIEHVLLYLRDGAVRFFSLSAVLTALGLGFMLHADYAIIFVVLLAIAFVQKYILRLWGHHVFNPSNLAVSLGLILFPYNTFVVMGQWDQHLWLGIFLFVFGFAILWRVQRLWIPLFFVLAYVPLQLLLVIGPTAFVTPDFLWTRIFSGAFLIYSIFMLTDPRTTPQKKTWQAFFVFCVALTATLLDVIFDMAAAHLFWALTAVSALVPMMRMVSKETAEKGSLVSPRVIVATSCALFTGMIGAIIVYHSFF